MENPKQVLIYDISAIPTDADIDAEKVMYLYREHQLLLYDSSRGKRPKIVNINDIEVTFLDLSKEEQMKKWNNYKEKIK